MESDLDPFNKAAAPSLHTGRMETTSKQEWNRRVTDITRISNISAREGQRLNEFENEPESSEDIMTNSRHVGNIVKVNLNQRATTVRIIVLNHMTRTKRLVLLVPNQSILPQQWSPNAVYYAKIGSLSGAM